MLVNLTEIFKIANEKECAVGAFNVSNLESAMAIIQAAEEEKKPVIINYAGVHGCFLDIEIAAVIMVDFAKRAGVPVCVHLDHGSSIEECMKAIQLGFTSVMIDASAKSFEENVKETAEVVRIAHSLGVTVEAELGNILSSNIGVGETTSHSMEEIDVNKIYTDPKKAKEFVEKTGVDALAIAFGTAHGIYEEKPVLDLDRVALIKESIDIPLVMHGGSGLSKEEFQTAVKNGIRKINYYTYMTLKAGKEVSQALEQKKGEPIFFHDIPMIAIKAMKEDVQNTIRMFSLEC